MSEQAEAQNYTMEGFVIERSDSAPPSYFSAQLGRDFGSPSGGWTSDRAQATNLCRTEADELLETSLLSMAPFCKVVAA